ncbi:MAG TPA: transposase [Solirubrobacteraceae bacterium]|nr:transposase [Solirubrobacteraceae bacterium]
MVSSGQQGDPDPPRLAGGSVDHPAGRSKATASRMCEELRERFQAFRRRDLYDIHLTAPFLDATFIAVRPDGPEEGRRAGPCSARPARRYRPTTVAMPEPAA